MTTQEKELVQDVVDRLLYLHDKDRQHFDGLLKDLLDIYYIPYEVVDNIRVYSIKPKEKRYVRE